MLSDFNFDKFKVELAQSKVYDAWEYVESMIEILSYMELSYSLIHVVYEDRCRQIEIKEYNMNHELLETGEAGIDKPGYNNVDYKIADLTVDSRILLRKAVIEFFHYARVSGDILCQVINASVLGDKSLKSDNLAKDLTRTLKHYSNLHPISNQLESNRDNKIYKYIRAFDNHTKHERTVNTVNYTIINSFLIGNKKEFKIQGFNNDNKQYPEVDAIAKVDESYKYIDDMISSILLEVEKQLPNWNDNKSRIQQLTMNACLKSQNTIECGDYIAFFIEVQESLEELPKEIKVRPLQIGPNNEVHTFDFEFKKIFIKKSASNGNDIIGCAEIKDELKTDEFYRVFTVRPCDLKEFSRYASTFSHEYNHINIDPLAIKDIVVIYGNH